MREKKQSKVKPETPSSFASSPRFLVDFDLRRIPTYHSDVLVIGSGTAGLSAAMAASKTRDVIVVAKGKLSETNTAYAQGGIAAVLSPEDSLELHAQDTLSASQGIGEKKVIRAVVEAAPAAVHRLIAAWEPLKSVA